MPHLSSFHPAKLLDHCMQSILAKGRLLCRKGQGPREGMYARGRHPLDSATVRSSNLSHAQEDTVESDARPPLAGLSSCDEAACQPGQSSLAASLACTL